MMFNQYIYNQLDDEGKIQHIREALFSDPNSIISRIHTSKDEEILTQALSRLDENNNTLLHLAVKKNHIILVKYLLSRLEINPFLKNKNDQTALYLSKNQEITNCLIENHVLIGVDDTFSKEVLNNKIAIGKKIRFRGDPKNPPNCLRDYSSFKDYIALHPHEKAPLLNRLQQYLNANEATQNSIKLFVQKIYNALTFQHSFNPLQQDIAVDAEDSNKKLTYEEKKAKLKSEVEELNQLLEHYQGELDRCAKHRTSITQMRGSSGGVTGTPMNMDPAVACFCIAVLAVFCLASWLSEEDHNDLTQLDQDEIRIIENLLTSLKGYYDLPLHVVDHQTAVKLIRQAREDSNNRLDKFLTKVPRATELGFYGMKKHPLTIHQNSNSTIKPNNSPNADENTSLLNCSKY